MTDTDTICALGTATGGAIAIIRISGPKAIPSACSICSNAIATDSANTVQFARITDDDGEVVDETLISIFKSPKSYTGEDSVEVSCHGSPYIINKVLDVLIHRGCRMAHPGEFTMRAYLNGKLDLSQAEAVADLIASTNRATHQMALSQLRGNFSSELSKLRDQLLHLTTLLELELDFSDHEELEFADRKELLQIAKTIDERITALVRSFETGQALKQGIPVAIVGHTNVGKSTLLNRLLKDDRAIVSAIHGTTRDTVEDTININDVTFRFIDTAGIRQATDEVELIGIERTFQAINKARIVLWIVEQEPNTTEWDEMKKLTNNKKLLLVQNKIDRTDTDMIPSAIGISAKNGINIEQLEKEIYKAANIPEITGNEIIITSTRHFDALTHAKENLQRVIEDIKNGLSNDLISEDLRLVLSELAEITGGAITSQETLNNVFSHFCIGK